MPEDKKKHKIRNLVVKEVSLVDSPANVGATVEIYKMENASKKLLDLIDNDNDSQEVEKMNEKEVQAAIEKAAQEALSKKDAEIAVLKAMAEMTDAEKTYAKNLSDEKKVDFIKMDSAKRKDEIKKSQDSDEVLEYEGSVIRKSAVGDSQFALYKSMVGKLQKAEKDAAFEKSLREEAEFAKKAEKDYPNLPGKPEEKGRILKAISKLDKDSSEAILKTLSQANEILKRSFQEFGSVGETDSKDAYEELKKMAGEVQTKDNTTYEQAMDKVLRTPKGMELRKREAKERQSKTGQVIEE